MDLDERIIAVYCTVDDVMKNWTQTLVRANGEARLRERGPLCTLSDSEVICVEVVGAFLGHHEDAALLRYFQRHHQGMFPKAAGLHRTTFTRQAANLWKAKEQVWQRLLRQVPHQPTLSFIDSTPLPVCRFARATFCRRFSHQDALGLQASYGYDHVARQTFYGFRLHLVVAFPGVVTGVALTQAHIADVAVAPQLLLEHEGIVLGDRNYRSPALQQELQGCAPNGTLLTPPKKKSLHEDKRRRTLLSRLRYRVRAEPVVPATQAQAGHNPNHLAPPQPPSARPLVPHPLHLLEPRARPQAAPVRKTALLNLHVASTTYI